MGTARAEKQTEMEIKQALKNGLRVVFGKDVDFLLLCLRKVSYGPQVEMQYNHKCSEDSKQRTYAININDFIFRV